MLHDVLVNKGLSHREAETAVLVAKGLANKEVADRLFVTEKTVKFHLTNIYRKMKLKSRAQLIVWSVPHLGFVEPSKEPTITKPVVISEVDAINSIEDTSDLPKGRSL